MAQNLFCDWKRNHRNIKGRLVLVGFRLAHYGKKNRLLFILLIPHLVLYRVMVEWFLSVELPWKTSVGKGLIIYHGHALVVNDNTIIGENCTLRHCVTIGNKQSADGSFSNCPVLGNNVDIGANTCIIGPVIIGDNVKIGAGSVVIKDIPSNSVVAGNPARVIRSIVTNE